MSVTHTVFLAREKLPSREEWVRSIRAHGFDLELHHDFDTATFSGFLPCRYQSKEAGFEYLLEPVSEAELEDDVRARIGDRDLLIAFVTRSDLRGLVTAVIASAVLCSMTEGILWSEESNEFDSAKSAISMAKEMERSLQTELEKPKPGARPAVAAARAVDVDLRARVVFRGNEVLVLETDEAAPRRFTVRMQTAGLPVSTEARVLGLWQHGSGETFIRDLRIGGQMRAFDDKGVVVGDPNAPDIPTLITRLGDVNRSEAAFRALLAAGEPAAPYLAEAVSNARLPTEVRRAAAVILGRLGKKAAGALSALERLVDDPGIGDSVRRAIELIRRDG